MVNRRYSDGGQCERASLTYTCPFLGYREDDRELGSAMEFAIRRIVCADSWSGEQLFFNTDLEQH